MTHRIIIWAKIWWKYDTVYYWINWNMIKICYPMSYHKIKYDKNIIEMYGNMIKCNKYK
jgi:hypothetical protein